MDLKKLDQIIAFYKKHYKEIRLRENYKWEAAAEFARADVMKAADFPSALKEGLSGTGNLLDAGFYYPRTNLALFLKKDPGFVREMFAGLYNEEEDAVLRIRSFIRNAETMQRKYFTPEELPDHNQDEHAVSVYLFLQYPGKYYIYKYSAFRLFAEEIGYSYIPPRKSERNLPEYALFCEALRKHLLKDRELMKLEEERHRTYRDADPAYHLLTQDILICGTTYFRHAGIFGEKEKAVRPGRLKLKPVKQEVQLLPIPFYNAEEIVRYEAAIKEAAKKFILCQENIRVDAYRISVKKRPEPAAEGEGYDLSSWDRHGNRIYIAVKATAGSEDESFFISEAERKKSAERPEAYFLYRVFHFDPASEKGEYTVWQGDLTPLCRNCDRYRVVFGRE